ncbi:phage integrase [Leptolyngbya sp. Heron Island J]|uniref:phage integrase n=1 Tax=Leptolyngbya sp. Heron Island J TaxID=1385935 RepID=UPI0003B9568F|nr:phage integrase [Leptolyngbya sp. Heron Island J]ESA37725.1 phage integrase [Leptolyngbya sp. Heron Island J]
MAKPLTDKEITKLIGEANAFLKAERTKVALLRVSGMIYFQGTFPPKPDSKRAKPYQQKIASRLPCSRQGIKKARSEAVLLGAKLVTGQFDWSDYGDRTKAGQRTIGQWIEKFEQDYRSRNQLKHRTWRNGWLKYFRSLKWDEQLSSEALIEAVLSKPANTATRKQICTRLQAFADYADLEVDLLRFKGRYGRASQKAKELPSDKLIAEWCGGDLIRSPEWRRVAGLIAAFGLRPHEAFLGELQDDGQFRVREGKTGARSVRAFYPEWVDQWGLWGELPDLNAQRAYDDGRLGGFVKDHLRRTHKLPCALYDLRHAYAIRIHVLFGLSETVGAKLMGHTPDMHLSTYQRWLSDATTEAAIARALERDDRPMPPVL